VTNRIFTVDVITANQTRSSNPNLLNDRIDALVSVGVLRSFRSIAIVEARRDYLARRSRNSW